MTKNTPVTFTNRTQNQTTPKHTTARRMLAASGAGILALTLLTGCINPPLATGTGGSTGSGTDVTPTADPNSENGDNAENETHGDETEAPSTWGTQSECIVGEWLVDNEHIGAFFASSVPDSGVIVDTPTGDVTLTFTADGSATTVYNNWTMTARQADSVVTMNRTGTDRGNYTASDTGDFTHNDTDVSSVLTIETPAGNLSVDAEPASVSAQYTCDADTLVVTIDGDTSLMHRQ